MKKLAIALLLAGSSNAFAQDAPKPMTITCTVYAQADAGQPRLMLSHSQTGELVTTFVQVDGPVNSNGVLDDISLKVEPFDAVNNGPGRASNASNSPFIRVQIKEGWKAVLNRIRKGETLTITAGNEVISLPLAGSGVAVSAFQRCAP